MAILILVTAPVGLVAQVSDATSCAAIETRVRQQVGQGRPHALEDLLHCPEAGSRVLASLWRDGKLGPELFSVVRSVSQSIRSPELFEAVEATARNAGAPQDVRLGAVQVLVKYVDPREGLPTPSLATIQPGSTLWRCVDCGREATDSSYDAALRPRAFSALEALTWDTFPDVRRVATAVLQALARVAPGEIPVDASTVTASFDCARRQLTMANRSTVAWPMTLRQVGSPDSVRLAVRGTWGGNDGVTHLTLSSTQPAELYMGERLVLRAECTSTS